MRRRARTAVITTVITTVIAAMARAIPAAVVTVTFAVVGGGRHLAATVVRSIAGAVRLIVSLIVSLIIVAAGCRAPDPAPLHKKPTDAGPAPSGGDRYDLRAIDLPGWTALKNFAIAGSDGAFLIAGGEDGETARPRATLYQYRANETTLTAVDVTPQLDLTRRPLLPAAAAAPASGIGRGSPAALSFALLGGADFVEVTRGRGERSARFTTIDGGGGVGLSRDLTLDGLEPRSQGCVVGLPGGEYFFFGGENFGVAIDGGAMISPAGVVTPLPTAQSPGGRFAHACVYHPGDGLVYIFGGFDRTGLALDVHVFDRASWRWAAVGALGASRSGFYNYGVLGHGLLVIGQAFGQVFGEPSLAFYRVTGDGLRALPLSSDSTGITARVLPYGTGEGSGPRAVGVFSGDCAVVPVVADGGMPRLKEYCVGLDAVQGSAALDHVGLDGQATVGVYAVPGEASVIYVGGKSFFDDPLVTGRGVVVTRRPGGRP